MLSSDTIDMIAVDSLKWHRDSMLDDIIAWEDKTTFVHDDDYVRFQRLLIDFNNVLDYYGVRSKSVSQRRQEQEVKQNGI